jgi:tRNA threonylcarbamoyladenosine modification (KEOPS) complex Cgi121 subunit
MLKFIKEYGKVIEISGFRNVRISSGKEFSRLLRDNLSNGVEIQLFDADLIASWEHLYYAALNATMAFTNHCNVSKSLAVETVLYASAQRQIKKAIKSIGLTPQSTNAAILLISNKIDSTCSGLKEVSNLLGKTPDDTVLEMSSEKISRIRSTFGISEVETATASIRGSLHTAMVNLIIERMALLPTRL